MIFRGFIGLIVLGVIVLLIVRYRFFSYEKDWRGYEIYVADRLRKKGYSSVQLGPGSKDRGIDITCYKGGKKVVVQVKYYKSNVGLAEVQRHYGVAQKEKAIAVFVTSSGYTKQARQRARGVVKLFVFKRTK